MPRSSTASSQACSPTSPACRSAQPGQGMEPVERDHQAPGETAQRVAARDVHELVLHDHPPPLLGPVLGRRAEGARRAAPAAGQRRLDLVGREQAHRPRSGERASGLVQRLEPGPDERTRRRPAARLSRAARAPSPRGGHDADQPHRDGGRSEPVERRDARDAAAVSAPARDARRLRRRPAAVRRARSRTRASPRPPPEAHGRPDRRAHVGSDPARHERQLQSRQHHRQGGQEEQARPP